MEANLSLHMKKKKSTSENDEKLQQKYKCLCRWFYLSHLKNKKKRELVENIGDNKTAAEVPVSKSIRKVKITRVKMHKCAVCTDTFSRKFNFQRHMELVHGNRINKNKSKRELEVIIDNKTAVEVLASKSIRKTKTIRLPKMCTTECLVTLFTNLSDSGAERMDIKEIMNAVNIVISAKKDLDQGKQWNGNIEIAKNSELKLYKSGLVLVHKK